ncbi:MAG TPA: hypothetical protein VGF58_04955 [Burkholderiales bacterium]|jgi:hypothetical protein
MSVARVDLMASTGGNVGGVTWHHLFVVATDTSGGQAYLRAAPQCLPLERLAGRKSALGDATENYEPSPAGPFGTIAFSSGPYEPGGIDFDPAAANVTLASGNAAAQLWEKAGEAAKAIGAEQISYDPIGRGANWAIMEALRRCGVQPALPPKRWAPGSGALGSFEALGVTRRVGQSVVIP